MSTKIDGSPAASFRVLIVDDDPVQCRLVAGLAARMGGASVSAGSVGEAIARLEEARFDVALVDLGLPDGSGLEVLARLRQGGAWAPPAIVQTARAGIETVVEAMRAGAFDFAVKPVSPVKLEATIRAALAGRSTSEPGATGGDAPGEGPMGEALRLAGRAARSAIPVLLTGETGTGKEWLARRIVAAGGRARGPFVAINCGALPRDLAETILFGHERGAFTGAEAARPGRFLEADGGTLMLDEIGELAPELQVKLLRALQEGEVEPVGGAGAPRRIDVRVIAATNRDLAALMADGRFREDLYWRLAAFPIHLPPLRERPGEVPALARLFAGRLPPTPAGEPRRLSAAALAHLATRPWPGNIRELENAVRRAGVLADGAVLDAEHFGGADAPSGAPGPAPADGPATLAAAEEALIREALARNGGRLARTALDLGIGRSTLYRKLRGYGPGDGVDG